MRKRGPKRGTTRKTGKMADDFVVYACPDDKVLGKPLWNAGARFSKIDVAGMLLDGGLPAGMVLVQCGRKWTVRGKALVRSDTGERMVAEPVPWSNGARWAKEATA